MHPCWLWTSANSLLLEFACSMVAIIGGYNILLFLRFPLQFLPWSYFWQCIKRWMLSCNFVFWLRQELYICSLLDFLLMPNVLPFGIGYYYFYRHKRFCCSGLLSIPLNTKISCSILVLYICCICSAHKYCSFLFSFIKI